MACLATDAGTAARHLGKPTIGNSAFIRSTAQDLAPGDHPLAERFNMAYMNTVVTRGRMELLVSATGMDTVMGRITGLLAEAQDAPTPLQVQLDALGKRLALIAGVVVSLIFALGLWRGDPLHSGQDDHRRPRPDAILFV